MAPVTLPAQSMAAKKLRTLLEARGWQVEMDPAGGVLLIPTEAATK